MIVEQVAKFINRKHCRTINKTFFCAIKHGVFYPFKQRVFIIMAKRNKLIKINNDGTGNCAATINLIIINRETTILSEPATLVLKQENKFANKSRNGYNNGKSLTKSSFASRKNKNIIIWNGAVWKWKNAQNAGHGRTFGNTSSFEYPEKYPEKCFKRSTT